MIKIRSVEARTIRLHLAIIGLLGQSFCTLIWGIRPWNECVMADKILSIIFTTFILQCFLMKAMDLTFELRMLALLSWLVFIYIHWCT